MRSFSMADVGLNKCLNNLDWGIDFKK